MFALILFDLALSGLQSMLCVLLFRSSLSSSSFFICGKVLTLFISFLYPDIFPMNGFNEGIGQQRSKVNGLLLFTAGPQLSPYSLQINSKLFSLQASGTTLGAKTGSTTILKRSFIILGSISFINAQGVPKYGLVLHSISQRWKSSSRRKSKPNNSKTFWRRLGFISCLTDRNVSMQMSFIRGSKCS